jgi:hypothetical protein
MTTKTFDLGTVLTVTTGRMLTDMGSLYEILNFMTGESLMTHQLPRASEACEEPLLAQFPKLAEVQVPEKFTGDDLAQVVADWVADQEKIYGSTFEVEPLESFEHKNPLTELAEMTDKPIIVVGAEDKS